MRKWNPKEVELGEYPALCFGCQLFVVFEKGELDVNGVGKAKCPRCDYYVTDKEIIVDVKIHVPPSQRLFTRHEDN
jgi:hypothetical protein